MSYCYRGSGAGSWQKFRSHALHRPRYACYELSHRYGYLVPVMQGKPDEQTLAKVARKVPQTALGCVPDLARRTNVLGLLGGAGSVCAS